MLRSLIIICTLALLFSGCAQQTTDIEKARETRFPDDSFKEYLRQGYVHMADSAAKNHDSKDAKIFGNKAMFLVKGYNPSVENLEYRNLPADKLNELAEERNFLVTAFARGLYQEAPEPSAKAQLSFDCWVEQTDKGKKAKSEAEKCKRDYFEQKVLLSNILRKKEEAVEEKEKILVEKELLLQNKKKLSEVRALDAQRQALIYKEMPAPYIVFFDSNKHGFSTSAKKVLDQVALEINRFNPDKIIISGHTDTVGNHESNMALSAKRGNSMAEYLADIGTPEKLFDIRSYGENDLRVDTPNNKPEQANRYGEIWFFKNNKALAAPASSPQLLPQLPAPNLGVYNQNNQPYMNNNANMPLLRAPQYVQPPSPVPATLPNQMPAQYQTIPVYSPTGLQVHPSDLQPVIQQQIKPAVTLPIPAKLEKPATKPSPAEEEDNEEKPSLGDVS